MTDKELLELAAKAAGIKGAFFDYRDKFGLVLENGKTWNPLTDDGDALRLAVKLDLLILNRDDLADAYSLEYSEGGLMGDDCANYRRAIVRAAAEIGKSL